MDVKTLTDDQLVADVEQDAASLCCTHSHFGLSYEATELASRFKAQRALLSAAAAVCEYAGHKSHCEMLADVMGVQRPLECTCGLSEARNKQQSLRGGDDDA